MFNILEPGARNKYGSLVYREPVLFLGAAGESVWLDGLIWGTRCYASRDVVVAQRRLGGWKLKLKKKGENLWESEECGVGWIDEIPYGGLCNHQVVEEARCCGFEKRCSGREAEAGVGDLGREVFLCREKGVFACCLGKLFEGETGQVQMNGCPRAIDVLNGLYIEFSGRSNWMDTVDVISNCLSRRLLLSSGTSAARFPQI
ncbi:hypothetical protein F5882DRAFT_379837 [Hyaloscypha sp. PMI_1271]|nr:hypothetical protein F5882DRAFT_379837 [Hyaloscypha sp. PMI_1271]